MIFGVFGGVFWCQMIRWEMGDDLDAGAKGTGKGKGWPRRVGFDGAVVMVDKRADGRFSVRWREEGVWRRTTRAAEGVALSWAGEKARRLARGTGERWVRAGEAEAVDVLRGLARGEAAGWELGRLAAEVAGAVDRLGGVARLREAVDYFMVSGPGAVVVCSLGEALAVVRAEYDGSRAATRNTMRVALDHMRRVMDPEVRLADVSREMVEGFVFEGGRSVRTARNRLSQAGTFFSRCRELGFWPVARPLPTEAVRRPRLPDQAPVVFSPVEGEWLLAEVGRRCPRYLPYLVMAGWLGCRPSECLRVRWEALDLVHGVLHLSAEVVGKTARERWVPVEGEVLEFFRRWRAGLGVAPAGGDRVCLTRSREELSVVARGLGLAWPADVLRHSAITYQLQVLGNDFNLTAERMGNSPKIIVSNYRRPIPAGVGERWFGLLAGVFI